MRGHTRVVYVGLLDGRLGLARHLHHLLVAVRTFEVVLRVVSHRRVLHFHRRVVSSAISASVKCQSLRSTNTVLLGGLLPQLQDRARWG